MNEQAFRAWADEVDSKPSYHSGGFILSFRERGEIEKRSRQVPPWKRRAARRQYQLRLMLARLEMEELL